MIRILPIVVFLLFIIGFGAYWSRTRIEPSKPVNSFQDCIDAGFPVMESYPRQCRAYGKSYTEEIIPEEDNTEPEQNIIVTSPKPTDTIKLPFTIQGKARVFENRFAYRIVDSNETIIQEGYLDANSPDIGLFGDFSQEITWVKETLSDSIKIEVYSNSPKDGSEINLAMVPVNFDYRSGTKILSFFGKGDNNDCETVYPLARISAKTQTPLRESISILLKGPLTSEKNDNYANSIKFGTSLKSIELENGLATVDFSREIDEGVAGSCMALSIRNPIEQTLKQFSTVKNVKILVQGSEEGLQP